jgi:hypothetical protein
LPAGQAGELTGGSAGFVLRCSATVEASPLVGVAEQKLPNPWVGKTSAEPGSSSASRRTDWNCAWVSPLVCSGPTRSVRPVAPDRQPVELQLIAGSDDVSCAGHPGQFQPSGDVVVVDVGFQHMRQPDPTPRHQLQHDGHACGRSDPGDL